MSLSVKRGEFLLIFGHSGGGKTSLLNILGTIDRPTKGSLSICGINIDSKTSDKVLSQIRLNNLGFVYQTFNLISSLTALENVEMPMILAGKLSKKERRERAIALLKRVRMGDRLDHYPSQLSGGEQQRVTIARAIANKPDILLLDEPTGDLDTKNTNIVMKLLTDLNKEDKITLIMVTHDVHMKGYSDRVVWMRDGKIIRIEKTPKEVQIERYKQLYEDLNSDDVVIRKRAPVGRRTQMRSPTDYETHPDHVKREETFYKFSKLSQEEYERLINMVSIKNEDNVLVNLEANSHEDTLRTEKLNSKANMYEMNDIIL